MTTKTSHTKRLLDLMITIPLVIVLLPLMLIISLFIKLTSHGPILFRQSRIGKDGIPFMMLKFRTMRTDMPDANTNRKVSAESHSRSLVKMKVDPRVTSIGKILRRTSLDELPQLVNILGGTMSLVGPRPLIGFMINMDDPRSQQRQSVLPGITGLWQISAREQNLSVESMYPYDLKYVRELSIVSDLKILLRTIPAVLFGGGAW
jgi:lipopolysaccharide/colanic/teichoic acid biosynthesis glycosyltransferase